ncbi:hypothetical protein HMPREF9374_0751 [Desmospora sp. 8437]|uniref:YfhD-like protein n=2 Tax=Kroppenstedtia eburnea TaxID=714067 RepID=A0A1N7IX46_9BACL|nr:hypothetical protein HMPREF9374_0751 [Desmospora sp. 8437]SIS41634.1 hypothetical protein SAMN05421790_101455 [Kroppenstedtia eburnea]
MILGAEVNIMARNKRPTSEKEPRFAPDLTDQAIKAEATEEEIRRGEYTEVTRLEPAPDRDGED